MWRPGVKQHFHLVPPRWTRIIRYLGRDPLNQRINRATGANLQETSRTSACRPWSCTVGLLGMTVPLRQGCSRPAMNVRWLRGCPRLRCWSRSYEVAPGCRLHDCACAGSQRLCAVVLGSAILSSWDEDGCRRCDECFARSHCCFLHIASPALRLPGFRWTAL
jgi:hypothetical protein